MEDILEHMGFKRSNSGPRISDPAHTRDAVYSYASSTTQQGIKASIRKETPTSSKLWIADLKCRNNLIMRHIIQRPIN